MSEADFTDQALRGEETPPVEPDTPTEEPAPQDEAEPDQPETVEEQLLAGRYKTPEELERAHLELRQLQGQQANELGQIRQQLEALNQPDYQPTDAPLPTDETMDAVTELVEQGRMSWQEAVQWAGTQSPHLYNQVMDSWYEYEPRHASRYETAQMVEQRQAQLAHEVAPYVQANEEQQTANRVYESWRQMTQKYPDFNEVGQQINEHLADHPELAGAVMSPDPNQRERALDTLYRLAKYQQQTGDTQPQPAPQAPVNAAKTAAAVATASSTQTRGDTGRQAQINAYLDRIVGGGLSVESGLSKPD